MDVRKIDLNLETKRHSKLNEQPKETRKVKSKITRDVENDLKRVFSVFC